jgi:hypothetical protein
MFGKECTVDLIDMDFDCQREIYLRFSGGRMPDAWLFKWDGLGMTNMTPMQSRRSFQPEQNSLRYRSRAFRFSTC